MIEQLIVVEKPEKIKISSPLCKVISAKDYLVKEEYANLKTARIYNLCESYRYQSLGYYVSLLAMARNHKVIPDNITIQDLKNSNIVTLFDNEYDEIIQKKLKKIKSPVFPLSIYFGRNMADQYDELAKKLFSLIKAPIMRAEFKKSDDRWELDGIRTLSLSDVPEHHMNFFLESAHLYFSSKMTKRKEKKLYTYDLAILVDPNEKSPPSNKKALQHFIKSGKKHGMNVEIITKEETSKILEYDALFIRETTNVNHHTYRISRKAQAEGLVVVDDPESILKCANKVFLEEIFRRNKIPRPKTIVLHRDNIDQVLNYVGLPCILKKPDSAFSLGVKKASSREQYDELVKDMLSRSDLIIVQEFLPSDFDWRIGILGGKALYACKYYMAKGHWQIYNNKQTETDSGDFETLPIEDAPENVVEVATKAAALIGNGLYGVDLKEVNGKVYLIEINDNPNIDFGIEDKYLGEKMYDTLIEYFLEQLNHQHRSGIYYE
jgi:glutathione synthase/RimK-type ligase-like ATP-grasp enzyme